MDKGLFMKRTLKFIFTFLFLFTVACLLLFWITGSEPSTLITCVFASCSLEGGALAMIKSIKIKETKKTKQSAKSAEGEELE